MLILKVQFSRIEVNFVEVIILKRSTGYCFWTMVSFLFGPLVITGRVLWNRVCPSFCPAVRHSICPYGFLSSSYSQKCLLANEISVFFNHQYFFNRSSSDFDIWHVDRHEWKEQGLLTGFLKKILIVANKPFMAQKMVHPHNSGSAVRIFLKIFHNKRGQ